MEGAREIDPVLRAEIDAYRARQAYIDDVDRAIDNGILTYDDADLAIEAYDNMGERPDIPPEVHEEWKAQQIEGQQQLDL